MRASGRIMSWGALVVVAALVAAGAVLGLHDAPKGAATGLAQAVAHGCRTAKQHCGLVPAPGGVTDSLHLDRSRAHAGQRIDATLTIENHRHSPVTLPDTAHGCRPKGTVVLANRDHVPSSSFAAVCVSGHITLPPGRITWSFHVITTYDGCAPVPVDGMPRCGAHGLPPLPPGRYVAVLVGWTLPLPQAVSAPLTLTAAG